MINVHSRFKYEFDPSGKNKTLNGMRVLAYHLNEYRLSPGVSQSRGGICHILELQTTYP